MVAALHLSPGRDVRGVSPVLLQQLHGLMLLRMPPHVALQTVHVGGCEIAAATPVGQREDMKQSSNVMEKRKDRDVSASPPIRHRLPLLGVLTRIWL